jgi:WD40 repeat protein
MENGATVQVLDGHTDRISGLCEVSFAGLSVLASASDDRTVRLWNPLSGTSLMIPVHYGAVACAAIDGDLGVGLDSGILVLDVRVAIKQLG